MQISRHKLTAEAPNTRAMGRGPWTWASTHRQVSGPVVGMAACPGGEEASQMLGSWLGRAPRTGNTSNASQRQLPLWPNCLAINWSAARSLFPLPSPNTATSYMAHTSTHRAYSPPWRAPPAAGCSTREHIACCGTQQQQACLLLLPGCHARGSELQMHARANPPPFPSPSPPRPLPYLVRAHQGPGQMMSQCRAANRRQPLESSC